MKAKLITVHPSDNVAVALMDLYQGDRIVVNEKEIIILNDIKAKHKVALVDLNEGDQIFMYGVLVGKATSLISKGGSLTTKNVQHQASVTIGKTETSNWTPPDISKWKDRTFMGYHREDGQVGTNNVWLFFPLVFCENRNIEILKDVFETELSFHKTYKQRQLLRNLIGGKSDSPIEQTEENAIFENVEVKFITHQGGCGGIRQDALSLSKLLAGYVNNPNVAGATVLSLGCQNLQVDIFKNSLKAINSEVKKPILIYEQQQMGTIDDMLNTIIKDAFVEIKKANDIQRKPAPLSKLKLGLECGGSDGFS
ncbi:UxaA family hydrolase, partial [Aegicerativicinus sediminis]